MVKILLESDSTLSDFSNELELLMAASHQNVIEISSVFHKNDDTSRELCYSMQIVKQGDLITELLFFETEMEPNAFRDEFLYDTLIQILGVLSFLHEGLRVCHRDIKPQNIFLSNNYEVKIADFGISKRINGKMETETKEETLNTTSTGFAGTLQYIAPEVI